MILKLSEHGHSVTRGCIFLSQLKIAAFLWWVRARGSASVLNNSWGVDSVSLGWVMATQKNNPPPDLLIHHHYPYCAVSSAEPNGEDPCWKFSLWLDEAANAAFFNLCWELLQSRPVKFCSAGKLQHQPVQWEPWKWRIWAHVYWWVPWEPWKWRIGAGANP